ncbi:helix-turn-helix transcriptional regulator [Veillonella caviae]|uniref:helix-turn-helix domain-containing protein n=1 Tax=Veillonella caviae TaxID=248316 RepID=UPI002A90C5E1|nr:helix-turn-helix transcriptional regulator [Veillonella caviae]MDD7291501.1 helix-turn-helix transcriptional regulator [Veillonella caviae]MDY5787517.1 helix-turn-helix transcriptional regulator [Veillonella caviae]
MNQEDVVQDGLTLKAARVNVGLTQKQAANGIGVSESTLLKYEQGKSYPDVKTLKKIEKLYKIPYHRIIFL